MRTFNLQIGTFSLRSARSNELSSRRWLANWFSIHLCLIMFTATVARLSLAQTINHSNWQSHAELRLKSIYDAGDFRAKNIKANWLSDSSGFLVDEVDPSTKKQVTWFYDSKTGDRRLASDTEKANTSNSNNPATDGKLELRTGRGSLRVFDRVSKSEIALARHLRIAK